jgi:hypothetical protein
MKWMVLALLTVVPCCSPVAVPSKGVATSITTPQASLAGYNTFSFGLADQPQPGYDVTARALEVQRRLRPMVLQALRERGYVEDESKADFVVKLAAGTGAVPKSVGERTVTTGSARGFIGIRIYDKQTGSEVWAGTAFAEIEPEQIDDKVLEMGVAHMLASFPTKSTARVAAAP